jgi:hypothetical protein
MIEKMGLADEGERAAVQCDAKEHVKYRGVGMWRGYSTRACRRRMVAPT